ncbi:MAG: hypothetical protein WCS77_06400 [Elusimicrobiaceae bacterium]|jgi:rubrerythrin
MFTKQDFLDYFGEMEHLEEEALRVQQAVAESIKNPELKETLTAILNDEVRHVAMAKNLIAILSNEQK